MPKIDFIYSSQHIQSIIMCWAADCIYLQDRALVSQYAIHCAQGAFNEVPKSSPKSSALSFQKKLSRSHFCESFFTKNADIAKQFNSILRLSGDVC